MWHFSMQGLPANNVTIKCRELLPHVFTFAPTFYSRDSYFLWHFLLQTLRQTQCPYPALHRCIALCCPDFPIRPKRRIDNPACSNNFKEAVAKITTLTGIEGFRKSEGLVHDRPFISLGLKIPVLRCFLKTSIGK